MKNRKFILRLLLLFILQILLIYSCSDILEVSDMNVPQADLYSLPYSYEELDQGAYISGSLFYNEENLSLNQLTAGMMIRVRLEKIDQYDPAKTKTVEYGVLHIDSIHSNQLVYDIILINEQGQEVVNKQNQVLVNGESVSLNRDKVADLYFGNDQAVKNKHNQFNGGQFLTFINNQEKQSLSLYMILEFEMPLGQYPLGLAGINKSGKLILKVNQSPQSSSVTTNIDESETNLIEEAVLEIDASSILEVHTGDYLVNQYSGSSYEIISIQQNSLNKVIRLRSIEFISPFEFVYLNVQGNALDLQRKFYIPTADSSENLGTTINVFNNTFDQDIISNGSVIVNLYAHNQMDIYVDAGASVGWFYAQGHVQVKAVAKGSMKVRVDLNAKKNWNPRMTLARPSFSFAIGPVPITLSMPIKVGVEIEVGSYGYAQLGFNYKAVAGTRTEVSIGSKNKFKNKPMSQFEITPIPLEIDITGYVMVKPYLIFEPTITVAAILHSGIDIKTYMEGFLEGNVRYTPTFQSGSINFDLYAGIQMKGRVAIGVEWLNLYEKWSLGTFVNWREKLYHWEWNVSNVQIASLDTPQGFTLTKDDIAGTVDLDWDPVNLALGYTIKRINAGKTNEFYTTEHRFTDDTGLHISTNYSYAVRAVNGHVQSPESSTRSTILNGPPSPTGVTVTALDNGNIEIDWDEVNGIQAYNVYRTNTSGQLKVYYAKSPPLQNSGLEQGEEYYYYVKSLSPAGESIPSTVDNASPLITAAPMKPSLRAISTTALSIEWPAVSGAYEYYIIRTTDGTNQNLRQFISSQTSFTDDSIDWDKTYYYQIIAKNYLGKSTRSASLKIKTATQDAPQVIFDHLVQNGRIVPTMHVTGKAVTGDVIPASTLYMKLNTDGWVEVAVDSNGSFEFPIYKELLVGPNILRVYTTGLNTLQIYAKDSFNKTGLTNTVNFNVIDYNGSGTWDLTSITAEDVWSLALDPTNSFFWLFDEDNTRMFRLFTNFNSIFNFGSAGSGDTDFGYSNNLGPQALVCTPYPSDDILVGDTYNNKVKMYTKSAAYLDALVTIGTIIDLEIGNLDQLFMYRNDGIIEVWDYKNNAQYYSFPTLGGGDLDGGIAIKGDKVYLNKLHDTGLLVYNTNGTFEAEWDTPYPVYDVESGENYLVLNSLASNTVWLMDYNGNMMGDIILNNPYENPVATVIDGEKIYILNNGAVSNFVTRATVIWE